ncbi:MAG TPA: CHAT domain-containing protein [Roseiflexaceae bacterium]|nr:CHAT domain-containing protein [Roseiflexaceae bacterium]
MPINMNDAKKDFVLFPTPTTVAEALAQLPQQRDIRAFVYVIVPIDDATYLVARWLEIEILAEAAGGDIRPLRLADLPQLLQRIDLDASTVVGPKGIRPRDLVNLLTPAKALDRAANATAYARFEREEHPGKRLIITEGGLLKSVDVGGGEIRTYAEGGTVVGLYVHEYLGASELGGDPFSIMHAAVLSPPVAAMLSGEGIAADAPVAIEDNRVINGWIEGPGRDDPQSPETTWRPIGKDEPLLINQSYELKFDIDVPRRTSLITSQGIRGLIQQLPDDKEELEITVEIVVDEEAVRLFDRPSAKLFVPRAVRPSYNRASFSILPLKTGTITITVIFYAFREVFQELEFKLSITDQRSVAVPGGQRNAIQSKASGMTLGTGIAAANPPRASDVDERVSLFIVQQTTGYQFILQAATVLRANIRLTEQTINDELANARMIFLEKLVKKEVNGRLPYLEPDTNVPPDVYFSDLRQLALLGRRLYRRVFFQTESGADAKEMGRALRELSKNHTLSIKIVADRFIFPWTFMYDDDFDPDDESYTVNPDGFWGFKHIVQYMPEFSGKELANFTYAINAGGDRLPMVAVFDPSIDQQFGATVIADQRKALGALDTVTLNEVATRKDVFALMRNPNAPPFIYFYCHAESMLPGERTMPNVPVGTGASYFTVGDGKVTLEDLRDRIDDDMPPFKSAPLIFLNACQGAELVPGQYDGLLPFLMTRGARGASGTEVNTPVYFAAEFAHEFITEFTRGEATLGEVMLRMRRKYRDEKHNIMGLIYALYSSGDLVVVRQ